MKTKTLRAMKPANKEPLEGARKAIKPLTNAEEEFTNYISKIISHYLIEHHLATNFGHASYIALREAKILTLFLSAWQSEDDSTSSFDLTNNTILKSPTIEKLSKEEQQDLEQFLSGKVLKLIKPEVAQKLIQTAKAEQYLKIAAYAASAISQLSFDAEQLDIDIKAGRLSPASGYNHNEEIKILGDISASEDSYLSSKL